LEAINLFAKLLKAYPDELTQKEREAVLETFVPEKQRYANNNNQNKVILFCIKPKDEYKDQHKTIFWKHMYIHALAKSATAEGIELSSLSSRVRNLTANKILKKFILYWVQYSGGELPLPFYLSNVTSWRSH